MLDFLDGAFEFDFDGDGMPDVMGYDLDGDGSIDGYEAQFDLDGDGGIDGYEARFDLDGDGAIDGYETQFDLDGDGVPDIMGYDLDGDGGIDGYEARFDADMDGVPDGNGFLDGDFFWDEGAMGNVEATFADDLENFDPAHADMDQVDGDPAESMQEWEFQGSTNRCALYAQKFVIEELTGMEMDIEELADLAESNGWFDEESGTSFADMDRILDYYGIQNEMSFYNDMEDIEECLQNGGKAIVSIDADEIWFGEEDNLFTPNDSANHAVEVIGIDHADPDGPMVILNDSGNPNGCGEMIPMDTFLDAWEDGNCQMISCA